MLREAVREREITYVRIILATGPSRPPSTSVLIRTYLGFYLEYKNNIGIVGKVKMSSSFVGAENEFGEAEAPQKNGLKPPLAGNTRYKKRALGDASDYFYVT